ncbi:NADH-quinone oxidoreductase subunit M [Parenemella sanctibonifatiensis]|uniref:NADH-quinone oxidoreductase subunit M n=1 Tax=Parenemella sanctibonifatiensis TaxID=2016505 RepID=A0A255E7F0_9ACTN|nr:NADH-quinone oxidoreductase subunit M [Parenemella sanctibonifatiensis]
MFPVMLTILGAVPLVGALVVAFLKGATARWVGLGFAVVTLALAVYAAVTGSDGSLDGAIQWIPMIGAHFALALDPLALVMVLLTVVLVPVVLIATWDDPDHHAHPRGEADPEPGRRSKLVPQQRFGGVAFVSLALALEGLAVLVFMASDVFLFYLLFEATLIPMYFLIGGFGGAKRASAAVKFLIFSLAGGLLMLAAVIGLYAASAGQGSPTYLISELAQTGIDGNVGRWLFVGFFIAFAVKAPMVGVHAWLPAAAEESTPGGATLLTGILDKLGTFGMIKICLGIFPEASQWATPLIIIWAVISILYGALAAIGQRDLMRFVAFTSISHFGFIVLGIFALTTQSLTGAIFYMVSHGLSTAALFLAVGYLTKRRGSRLVADFGGVQKVAPIAAGVLLVAGLSTLALPGMSSFVSEYMVLAGTFGRYPWAAAISAIAVVLAAVYVLRTYQRTMTGPVTEQVSDTFTSDLSGREKLAIGPLIALILVLGFFPKPMLDVITPVSQEIQQHAGVTDPEPKGANR